MIWGSEKRSVKVFAANGGTYGKNRSVCMRLEVAQKISILPRNSAKTDTY